jgi:hypothetical protein
MKRLISTLAVPALLLVLSTLAGAQGMKRQSPHETVTAKVGAATITIEYGRPYVKGRTIFGGLVPFDKVWRTGADEATTFTTDKDVQLGTLLVPAGKYALFTIPGEKEWTVILNKVSKTWGAFDYEKNKAQDLGKTTAKAEAVPATEQLTISIMNGKLNIVWDKTCASVPVVVR